MNKQSKFSKNEYINSVLEESMMNSDIWLGKLVVVANDAEFLAYSNETLAKIGCRAPDILPLNCPVSALEQEIHIAAVILHLQDWDAESQAALEMVEEFCSENHRPLIISISFDILDLVLANSKSSSVEYLLGNDPAEFLVSLQNRINRTKQSVYSNRNELDIVDLQKISADVERIAKVLTQLSGAPEPANDRQLIKSPFIEDDQDSSVSDASFPFKSSTDTEIRPFGTASAAGETTSAVSPKHVRDLIKARRLRDQYFDSELFADPAWDMLLDLLAARLEGTKVSVSSLCIASAVPPTTALRWIKTMTEENIFERKADIHDGRRIFIELSDDAMAGMIGFLSMIRRSKLMLV